VHAAVWGAGFARLGNATTCLGGWLGNVSLRVRGEALDGQEPRVRPAAAALGKIGPDVAQAITELDAPEISGVGRKPIQKH
jgi:hypothetical protein